MRSPSLRTTYASDNDAHELDALRPYLFSIAYRMLGSASDAEDIVQEAFLRFYAGDPQSVQSQKAYLGTVVTRLCLDHLKSARANREHYPGPWLPEPALTVDINPGPEEQAERREDVSLAFLVLLERLTPEERAAFVLREAFSFPYDDIAGVLGKSNAACRKLVQRARQRLAGERRHFRARFDDHRRLTERFLAAARLGDLETLTETLAADVTVWVDGGPETLAARRPIYGRDKSLRFLVSSMQTVYPDAPVTFEDVNGELGILFWDGETLVAVTTVEVHDGAIAALRSVVNPEKLAYLRSRITAPSRSTA